jgi:pimeloyl-ACP methyl ester carboxylesterase
MESHHVKESVRNARSSSMLHTRLARSGSVVLPLLLCLSGCDPSLDQPQDQLVQHMALSPDGVAIAYEDHGAGSPTLVLVHGWSCDRTYWEGQIADLSSSNRVVAVDLAGHGESGVNRDDWTIESFGRDVAAVANALELEDMVLVGHSMGGDVILEAARSLPGRVNGLVWIDTYKQLGSPRTAEEVAEIVAPFRADFVASMRNLVPTMFSPTADSALVAQVTTDMAAAPPDIAAEALESSFTYGRQVTTPVQQLSLPIVAINPAEPPSDVESLERYGVEVVPVPEVGHFIMLEDPERFNAVLRDVITRFQQGS